MLPEVSSTIHKKLHFFLSMALLNGFFPFSHTIQDNFDIVMYNLLQEFLVDQNLKYQD
uniref:Uncharacterized protein n=1 Tax=Rhizophagus irregularis (strain DAOM 181602 / DAOM 197198 / MUCL 43194) TaxID=747089 RepID=U9UYS3_RHIID